MIAEVFPSVYDAAGRPVFAPRRRRGRRFGPNAPFGRHVSQPLSIVCRDLEEVRRFLLGCRYVSDETQFGRSDYWLPPEEFERRRCGDCEDFALWAWRQLMQLGYAARFVGGQGGPYGEGHAWVTFELDGRTFIVESQAAPFGPRFPRLSTLRYQPAISVAWDGRALRYYEHKATDGRVRFGDVAPYFYEWLAYWLRTRGLIWRGRLRRLVKRARKAAHESPSAGPAATLS